jgi:uncharacterized protein with HEPN domain
MNFEEQFPLFTEQALNNYDYIGTYIIEVDKEIFENTLIDKSQLSKALVKVGEEYEEVPHVLDALNKVFNELNL